MDKPDIRNPATRRGALPRYLPRIGNALGLNGISGRIFGRISGHIFHRISGRIFGQISGLRQGIKFSNRWVTISHTYGRKPYTLQRIQTIGLLGTVHTAQFVKCKTKIYAEKIYDLIGSLLEHVDPELVRGVHRLGRHSHMPGVQNFMFWSRHD